MARTFSTLFSESALRIALQTAANEDRFCAILEQRVANIKSYKNIFKANLPGEYAATEEGLEDRGDSEKLGHIKGHPDEENENHDKVSVEKKRDDSHNIFPKKIKVVNTFTGHFLSGHKILTWIFLCHYIANQNKLTRLLYLHCFFPLFFLSSLGLFVCLTQL